MTTVLIVYGAFATLVAGWALVELKAERIAARFVDECRESDRNFYRGWEHIWFAELRHMAEQDAAPKPRHSSKTKARSGTQLKRKKGNTQ